MLKSIEMALGDENEIRVMCFIDDRYDNMWSKAVDRFYDALVEQGDCQSDAEYEAMIQVEANIYQETILELIQWYKMHKLEEATHELLKYS